MRALRHVIANWNRLTVLRVEREWRLESGEGMDHGQTVVSSALRRPGGQDCRAVAHTVTDEMRPVTLSAFRHITVKCGDVLWYPTSTRVAPADPDV